jgi:hypothetical protein
MRASREARRDERYNRQKGIATPIVATSKLASAAH